jgi:hypothetical protein
MPPLIDECDFKNLEDDFEDSMVKLFDSALTYPSSQGMAREQAPGNSLSFHTSVRSRAGAEIISPLGIEEGFEDITVIK